MRLGSLFTKTSFIPLGSVALGLIIYELVATSGIFAAALMPNVQIIFSTLCSTIADGSIVNHAGATLSRVLLGWFSAIAIALPLGVMMARQSHIEKFFMPLVSVLMPIPSLAWVPIFILWFGLGNFTTTLIVFYAASFPMLLNTWTGVRSVNNLWIKSGCALGANSSQLFWKVIIPGASPMILTGVRQSFQRAWIAVIGAEMIAASDWGLGWVIFDAKEFLNADIMIASLVVIGLIGFVFERYFLQILERRSVVKWGMVKQQIN